MVETRVKPKVKKPARQPRPLDRVPFSQKRIRFCDTGIQREWGKITQKTTQKSTQKTAQKILVMLAVNPMFSRREIAKSLGDISENGVKYHLEKLKASGHIRRVGPDKSGHWEVLK